MKIEPVKTTPVPGYPDKYNGQARIALSYATPYRWIGAPLAVGVLSATVALGLTGCGDNLRIAGNASIPNGTETNPSIDYGNITPGVSSPTPSLSKFIPLFEYGDGTGSIGCVSITAPVFISEDDAMAILSAAFTEAGLSLNQGARTMEDATIPVTDLYISSDEDNTLKRQGDLTIDGTLDVTPNLPVVFVSMEDVETWHGDSEVYSTVSVYKMREAAKTLSENNPGLVVFYDPQALPDYDKLMGLEQKEGESDEDYSARWQEVSQEVRQAAKAESEQLLREQAEALINWLRAEGIH